MSSVHVEHRRCRRHGLCLLVAPDAVRVSRSGRVEPVARPSGVALEQAREAARQCPVQALEVRE